MKIKLTKASPEQFKIHYILFTDKVDNKVINNSDFYRIMYSDEISVMTGLNIFFSFIFYTVTTILVNHDIFWKSFSPCSGVLVLKCARFTRILLYTGFLFPKNPWWARTSCMKLNSEINCWQILEALIFSHFYKTKLVLWILVRPNARWIFLLRSSTFINKD